MWEKILLLVMSIFTFISTKYNKVLNWILFNLYFTVFYMCGTFVMFIWPFPILRGRSVENGKSWAGILKHLTLLFGLQWEIRNGEVLEKDRAAVIVSNHQSSVDVIGMFTVWKIGGKITALVKRDVIFIWPMALAIYLGGGVLLDRRNPKNAYKQLQQIADIILKEKAKVWLFPEGTRNFDYTKFLPFKKGAFTMAVAAQAPIIPVIFSPYYFIDRKNYTFSKSRVIVQCLEEVPTTGLTSDDVPELTERVRNVMLAAYKKLFDEVVPTTIQSTNYLRTNKH